jgi:hypothetical protein
MHGPRPSDPFLPPTTSIDITALVHVALGQQTPPRVGGDEPPTPAPYNDLTDGVKPVGCAAA